MFPLCITKLTRVLLPHFTQAAGNSITHFLWRYSQIHAPSGRNSSYTFKSCDVGRLGLVHSACPARRGWLRNVVEYAQVCAAQADALQNSEWSNPYLAFDCSTLSGHYDLQAFKYMDEATRKRTLVIASLREPRDLVVSLFNFLPLAHRRYCVADASELRGDQHHCSLASKHFDAEITLGDFVRGEAGLGIDLQGGMIKMIAGDYCCWNSDAPLMGSKQRLESAIAELENTVGVVLLKERMSESLRYLAYVLGWPTDIDTNIVINVSPHGSWASAPREVQHALTSVTRQDRVLYSYAERRLNEQLRSMKFNSK